MTVKETHESLGVSRSTLYRLVHEGKIKPTSRVGTGNGRMRFDAKEIHDYLVGATTPVEPAAPATDPPPEPPRRRSRSSWQTGEPA